MSQVILSLLAIGLGYLAFGWVVSSVWDFIWDD